MKKTAVLLLAVLLCLTLCSCDTLLQKAKSAVTGEEISEMPEDYVATLQNEDYEYELYETYVKIIHYLGTETVVTIPQTIEDKPVTVIGSFCFHDTEAEITGVNIPDSIIEIEEGAFYLAESLVSITVPDSVKKIGPRAFAWCNGLETVNLGNGITEIPEYCFNHCNSLVSVTIPSGITKIGLRAFSFCEKLSDQVVHSSVAEVGERAFSGCPALQYVTFENPSVVLGAEMFADSPNVIVISNENSSAMKYCAENGLRWSISKDIEAVVLGGEESQSSDDSLTE